MINESAEQPISSISAKPTSIDKPAAINKKVEAKIGQLKNAVSKTTSPAERKELEELIEAQKRGGPVVTSPQMTDALKKQDEIQRKISSELQEESAPSFPPRRDQLITVMNRLTKGAHYRSMDRSSVDSEDIPPDLENSGWDIKAHKDDWERLTLAQALLGVGVPVDSSLLRSLNYLHFFQAKGEYGVEGYIGQPSTQKDIPVLYFRVSQDLEKGGLFVSIARTMGSVDTNVDNVWFGLRFDKEGKLIEGSLVEKGDHGINLKTAVGVDNTGNIGRNSIMSVHVVPEDGLGTEKIDIPRIVKTISDPNRIGSKDNLPPLTAKGLLQEAQKA